MSITYVRDYASDHKNLREVSGSENETVLRGAFQACLNKYCSDRKLTLVTELPYKSVIPDGTVKDSLRLAWGYWEAKDSKDDLNKEIAKKLGQGYPNTNILFEDSLTAVLIQDGREVQRVSMSDGAALDGLISSFLDYEPSAIAEFRQAVNQFKEDLPGVLIALREMIDESHQNKLEFKLAAEEFLLLCQEAINPEIEAADVREMLIQHILTKDIFLKVFGEDQFHKENNIASRLDGLEETFFTGDTRRSMVDRLKAYYSAITVAAASIDSHLEKQQFLKAIYEDFYKIYNPKAADRLGVVYTPNEIVEFMIRATDELVHRHFGRHLYDEKVQILDPAAGTGTFITDLIEFMPQRHLAYKYANEIHANEVSILPYYIANLNIEYTYKQKTGEYKEFPNICFVDTLENMDFEGRGGQMDLLGSLSHENMDRVIRQNEKNISVVIGNPPYNANQRNENDNNKNRKYPEIDARIKETYIEQSTARKTKQYDMYKRFIRWASDRLDKDGVLAFVSNNAFIDARQDDGFRKVITEEFREIWVLDLKGNARTSGERRKREGGSIFEDKIRVGIAIYFFVKKRGEDGCDVYYDAVSDYVRYYEKIAHIKGRALDKDQFTHIIPDENNNWLNQTDNDFDELLCVANEQTKRARTERTIDEDAVFKLFSLGVITARDEWVYDFEKKKLINKVRTFLKIYEVMRNKFGGSKVDANKLGQEIKWTRDLKRQLSNNEIGKFDSQAIRKSLYRPFVQKQIYFQKNLNEMQYQMPQVFPSGKKMENKTICFSVNHKDFYALGCKVLPDYHFTGDSQCLPLYRYDKNGKRQSNITKWGLKQFRDHYNNGKITAEDIFHYTYAVLHSPDYLKKYEINLKRDFPRLPFYKDFPRWVQWGKTLMKLHIDFEKETPQPLKRQDKDCPAGSAKLKADKASGAIILDKQTTLNKVPPRAWEYQLGNRSALEWVLDQYKEKKIKDPTVREKFNTYKFADYKEDVIELLGKVCTVSVKTMKIVADMEKSGCQDAAQ